MPLQKLLLSDWFTALAALSSVTSLLVSAYVAWKVRKIGGTYRRIALTPNWGRKVGTGLKNLEYGIEQKDWSRIQNEAAKMVVVTKAVQDIMTGEIRACASRANLMSKHIVSLSPEVFDFEVSEKLIVVLSELKANLAQQVEELKWRA